MSAPFFVERTSSEPAEPADPPPEPLVLHGRRYRTVDYDEARLADLAIAEAERAAREQRKAEEKQRAAAAWAAGVLRDLRQERERRAVANNPRLLPPRIIRWMREQPVEWATTQQVVIGLGLEWTPSDRMRITAMLRKMAKRGDLRRRRPQRIGNRGAPQHQWALPTKETTT